MSNNHLILMKKWFNDRQWASWQWFLLLYLSGVVIVATTVYTLRWLVTL